ncbi:MAG: hypothetical protein V2B19_32865 [Pseudomonadota bacterium]
MNSGVISSSTWSFGDAGRVNIESGCLRIDGQGTLAFIGGLVGPAASGKAGTVTVKVADLLEVLNGGQISSDTFAEGDAGGVEIESGSLRIDGQGTYSGISSGTGSGSSGKAGTVTLKVADLLEVLNGGDISSSTLSEGNAGGVEIESGSLRIDGQGLWAMISSMTAPNSSGNAGTVVIYVSDLFEIINGGGISCATMGFGNAGEVDIESRRLSLDGQDCGALIASSTTSSGNAGSVSINVTDTLEVLNGSLISSCTHGDGNAGRVAIHAEELRIDGLGARADIDSASVGPAQGYAGDVSIETEKLTIQNGGKITIETHQIVSEENLSQAQMAHLFIESPVVILDQGAKITAESCGNAPAAAIGVTSEEILVSGNSSITTSSSEADGGSITIQGRIIDLRNSLITSSVEGATGNGGDITLMGAGSSSALILEGGFIQANAPAGATGGDIFIDVGAIIPEGGVLEVGGQERRQFEAGTGKNIIQAAAPGGEQGIIEITSPELDISGALSNIDAAVMEPIRIAADSCLTTGTAEGSSLVFAGAGGVPGGSNQHSALFLEGKRLDDILNFKADLDREKTGQADVSEK